MLYFSGSPLWAASTLSVIPALDYADGISIGEGAEHYVVIAKELVDVYKLMGYTLQDFYSPFSFLKVLDEPSFEEAVQVWLDRGKHMRSLPRGMHPFMHEDLFNGKVIEARCIISTVN